jgi:hypothetical protein
MVEAGPRSLAGQVRDSLSTRRTHFDFRRADRSEARFYSMDLAAVFDWQLVQVVFIFM